DDAALSEQAQGLGIEAMFYFEHTRGHVGGLVFRVHGDGLLQDDWARIVFLLNEMHRYPRPVHAVLDDRFMHTPAVHPLTPKCRKKCRVDVQHAMPKVLDDAPRNLPHVARQDDQVNAMTEEGG